jgi:uncharacterized protein YciI
MQFAIHVLDNPGTQALRAQCYDRHTAHLADLERWGVTIIFAARLVADDGDTAIGNLLLIEAPDQAAAEAFNAADPFTTEAVWGKAIITPFVQRRGATLRPSTSSG